MIAVSNFVFKFESFNTKIQWVKGTETGVLQPSLASPTLFLIESNSLIIYILMSGNRDHLWSFINRDSDNF